MLLLRHRSAAAFLQCCFLMALMRKSSGATKAKPSTSIGNLTWTFGRLNIGAQRGGSFALAIGIAEGVIRSAYGIARQGISHEDSVTSRLLRGAAEGGGERGLGRAREAGRPFLKLRRS